MFAVIGPGEQSAVDMKATLDSCVLSKPSHLFMPADAAPTLKVPQLITHERCLLDCEAEFDEFISRAGLLNEKLGPLLIQCPYFNKAAFATQACFLARLTPFLNLDGVSSFSSDES
jgi:hypothetical protein